jgi:hypothetical protein
MIKLTKAEKNKLIQERIQVLLIDHRAFSKRALYSKAKRYVEHHYGKKATRE